MTLAPWRSPLARALHRNRSRPDSRYLQLATLAQDGTPRNRTVVFRGFYPDSDRLMVVTDTRSDKAQSLGLQPCNPRTMGAACWYFPITREQFRLRGSLTLVVGPGPGDQATEDQKQEGKQAARHQTWQALSSKARQQFTWPHPGHPRAEGAEFSQVEPDPVVPPDTFGLLLLDPIGVDHLELRGEPQQRWQYVRQGSFWHQEAVNP